MAKTHREIARELAQNHLCEKYCGLVEDIEHELDVVRKLALEEAAKVCIDYAGWLADAKANASGFSHLAWAEGAEGCAKQLRALANQEDEKP